MKVKDKLDSLSPRKGKQDRRAVVSDLRSRLERLSGRRVGAVTHGYPRRERAIEELVDGQVLSTPYGEVFAVTETYGSGHRHGGTLLEELLDVPHYPAHLITGDERFRDIDFSRTLFLDTETTGLSGGTGTYAFMVGVGRFQGGSFTIQQLFMRNYGEEKAMLFLLGGLLDGCDFLVTFNGRNFDIPLLETRFILSRITTSFAEKPNYDLLFPSRRIWRGSFDNCRLVTLEAQLLDVNRGNDIPSELIPYYYFDFIRTGDAGKISQAFYHNRMDILSMVTLAHRIHAACHDPSAFLSRGGIEQVILGKVFMGYGMIERATDCLEEAFRLCNGPLQWDAMRILSLVYKKKGEWKRSAALWEDMVSRDGRRSPFPYVELAKYYEHRLKDYSKAREMVQRAFETVDYLSFSEREALFHRQSRVMKKERKSFSR